MNSTVRKGAYLALATALISGVSVYINSFGVREVPDPFVFTTAKNLLPRQFQAAYPLPEVHRQLQRPGKPPSPSYSGGLLGGQ